MSLPGKERQSAARARRSDAGQREPGILALCTARFGSAQPPSAGAPRRRLPPYEVPKPTGGAYERRQPPKATKTTTAGPPLRDPQTSVPAREIALVWKAEYRARCCCCRTPGRPRRASKDRARALGWHFAIGPGVAGIGSWLGASNRSPLAQQFAGAGLLAALRCEDSTTPPPPDLVPDDTGSEAEDEDRERPYDAVPPRPAISLRTTPAPATLPHQREPVTPTSPSLGAYESDVDPEPAALRTPVRKRAAKPAFGLMTPPPSVGRL